MNHLFLIYVYVRTYLSLHPSVMGDDPLQEAGDLMDVIVSVLVKIVCGMNRNQRGAVCTCCQPETKINTTYVCQCAYILYTNT